MYVQLYTSLYQEIMVVDEKFLHEVKGKFILDIFYAASLHRLSIIKPQEEGVWRVHTWPNLAITGIPTVSGWWKWLQYKIRPRGTNSVNFRKIVCLRNELEKIPVIPVMTSWITWPLTYNHQYWNQPTYWAWAHLVKIWWWYGKKCDQNPPNNGFQTSGHMDKQTRQTHILGDLIAE